MVEHSINFLHLSDTHFGVHYVLKPRNLLRRAYGELFFQKVEDVIKKAISKHHIDFIIHSGDFFNHSNPQPEVIDRGVKAFNPAVKKGIPIYLLPGNHERSKLPLGLLPFSDNINLFKNPSTYIFEKKGIIIKLTGFPYIRNNSRLNFYRILKQAWNNPNRKVSKNYHYCILVMHQLLEGSRIENHTFHKCDNVISTQQIPKLFSYVACGHIHRFQFLTNSYSTNKTYTIEEDCENNRWRFKGSNGFSSIYHKTPVISYAGSLDRVSFAERNESKGYIIGRLSFSNTNKLIQKARYQFHEVSPTVMIFDIWDLSKASIDDYATRTLEELYKSNQIHKSSQNRKNDDLRAVYRIKVKGKRYSNFEEMKYLKQEAKRLKIYLTITYSQ